MELQWDNGAACSILLIKLDSFHIAVNAMRVIGQHMCKSGLQEVLSEAMSSGNAQQVTSCKLSRTIEQFVLIS